MLTAKISMRRTSSIASSFWSLAVTTWNTRNSRTGNKQEVSFINWHIPYRPPRNIFLLSIV